MADALKLLGEIKSLSYATVDETGAAQVRVIDTVLHAGTLYFVTARGKAFYAELLANKTVGIVGLTKDWKMVRLTAKVAPVGRELVDLVFQKDPGIGDIYPGDSRRILEAFRVESGHGEVFDLSGVPVVREDVSFGGDAVVEKGFRIGENCIYCGTCAKNCPPKCIRAGEPFVILRENCLHCGLCAEVCPVQAVERL